MNKVSNKTSKLISSIKLTDNGQDCLIEFFSDFSNDDNIVPERYYTIVKTDLLKAYGGLPKKILIQPVSDPLGKENLFEIDSNMKPASFEGIPLQTSSEKFWSF